MDSMNKITKVTIAEPIMIGGEHKAVGEIIDLNIDDARYLAQCGRVRIGEHKIGTVKDSK